MKRHKQLKYSIISLLIEIYANYFNNIEEKPLTFWKVRKTKIIQKLHGESDIFLFIF